MRLTTQQQRLALLSSPRVTAILTACGGGEKSNAAAGASGTSASTDAVSTNGATPGTLESAAAVTPTSSSTWTKISSERNHFTLSSSQYVRSGAGTKGVGKYVSGKTQCVSSPFGSEPALGVTKQCEVYTASAAPAPVPITGSVAGYRVYYGTFPGAYSQVKGSGLYVSNTTFPVPSLTSGKTYCFAVAAVDASGKESPYATQAPGVMPWSPPASVPPLGNQGAPLTACARWLSACSALSRPVRSASTRLASHGGAFLRDLEPLHWTCLRPSQTWVSHLRHVR